MIKSVDSTAFFPRPTRTWAVFFYWAELLNRGDKFHQPGRRFSKPSFEKDRKWTFPLEAKRRLRPEGGAKLALSSSGGASGVCRAPVGVERRTRIEGIGRLHTLPRSGMRGARAPARWRARRDGSALRSRSAYTYKHLWYINLISY